MPAYHSKIEEDAVVQQTCSCGVVPLKTNIRGPADPASPGAPLTHTLTHSLPHYYQFLYAQLFTVSHTE